MWPNKKVIVKVTQGSTYKRKADYTCNNSNNTSETQENDSGGSYKDLHTNKVENQDLKGTENRSTTEKFSSKSATSPYIP